MSKYRKKPVVIEAVAFTRNNFDEIVSFTNGAAHTLRIERTPNGKCTCVIPTLEGEHIASEGDFIIKGVHGEFYPCKPDIFKKTYEEVDRPTTNADRIRSMNDIDLAEFLCSITDCYDGKCPAAEYCRKDHNGMREYLKQRAEEE